MSSSDLRLKFRQQIRARQIKQITKSKRQLEYYRNCKQINDMQQQEMYGQILRSSYRVFENRQDYLQMLRQAMSWRNCKRHKECFPEIVKNIGEFFGNGEHSDSTLILFFQCLALIFFQSQKMDTQITSKCLRICFHTLKQHQDIEKNDQLIKNRCLITIQNITNHDQPEVLNIFHQLCILQFLQDMLNDYPVGNTQKSSILSIYGNTIAYHIKNWKGEGYVYHFPNLLQSCFNQNYDDDIVQKSVEIYSTLLHSRKCDNMQIITGEVQILLMMPTFMKSYIPCTENFVAEILEFVCEQIHNFKEIHQILPNLDEISYMLSVTFRKNIQNHHQIPKIHYFLTLIEQIVHQFQELKQQKIINRIQLLLCFWASSQLQEDQEFQLFLLKALGLFVQDVYGFKQICSQNLNMNYCSVIMSKKQCFQNILAKAVLQKNQNMRAYLQIFNNSFILQTISEQNRSQILQKIMGCTFYQDPLISITAENILRSFDNLN